MMYGLAAGGLLFLFMGGEMLVRGSVALADRVGVSPLLIGLTVVAFGTSAPELAVCLEAALAGNPDIAVGNVVGSNIANILLILGVGAMISPIRCAPIVVFRDAAAMFISSVTLVALGMTGIIVPWEGGLMFAALVAFIGYRYWTEKYRRAPSGALHVQQAEAFEDIPLKLWVSLLFVVGGVGAVIGGADMLLEGAVSIARAAGLSEAVIGLTLVAVGTSLPELATAIVAAIRRHPEVAIGNVLGSNIFNIMGVLGITAMVTPVPISAQIIEFDLWVMLAVAAASIPVLMTGWRVDRIEAAVFLTLYAAYVSALFLGLPERLGAAA
ncbi:MAG: calcium/sodium antiporter [Proteobacteria bacterium]|nr:calcium/sodium antiporter [Pseudomonadota bacterium]